MTIKIAPSILSADLGALRSELEAAAEGGADWIHLDVMDGHFVPNITIGPMIAAAARKATTLPLDAHLMISEPDRYLDAFADAGVDSATVHVEACPHLHRTVQRIKEAGMKAGVALNPATSAESIREILPDLDLVLVMSVNPGFGGQRFIQSMVPKIGRVKAMIDEVGKGIDIQVDGGVTPDTIGMVYEAGATVVVAGTAVYNQNDSVAANLAALRSALSNRK